MECQVALDEIAELSRLHGSYELGKQRRPGVHRMENLLFLRDIFVNDARLQLEHVLECLPTAYVDVEVHVKNALDVAGEATLEGGLCQLRCL